MHPTVETSNMFQPYAFLLAGRRRGSSTTSHSTEDSPTGSTGYRTPPQRPSDSPRTPAADLGTEHAKFLEDHLDFIVPPRINPVDTSDLPTSEHCLFLGHLKFETTPADVRWLIKKLCGVTALKAEFRGNGCVVVYLANEKDELAVRGLNRRVLFDHGGMWFARTAKAVDVLMDYVEKVLPRLGGRRRCLRLPRDSLVVEESRSAKKAAARRPPQLSSSAMSSPKDLPRMYAGSPPTPYSLGSSAMSAGFHIAPPEYTLPESNASSFNASCNMPPPPYMF